MNDTREKDPQESVKSRDAENWAKPVSSLNVSTIPDEATNLNVEGRQIVGPLQGFGQMWQKTYRIRLEGSEASPESVISTWKSNFSDFWPDGNDFYTSLTGIAPGEVAVINLSGPGGVPLSTGIIVIYADDVSFSFMNPEGHMFAGMITFSAYEDEGATEAQVQVLIRANDPLYEIGCRIGIVHKREDQFWHETLRALARHFGVEGDVQQQVTLVDPKIQWSKAGNLWQNAAIRSGLYMPIGWLKRLRR